MGLLQEIIGKKSKKEIERDEKKEKIRISLNDEIALKTSFKPLKKGGPNLRAHELIEISPRRLEFRVTIQGLLFASLFIILGLSAFIGGIIYMMISKQFDSILIMMMGIAFTAGGFSMYWTASKPRVFDLDNSYYWIGKKGPQNSNDSCLLSGVYAVQLLAEFVITDHAKSGKRSSFYSYELNLVLNDGERMNIIDQDGLQEIREYAKKVSKFLNVPLWDFILDSEKK